MMNKKFLTMMFSLLLAVGWTSSAQAQKKEMRVVPKMALAPDRTDAHGKAVPNQQRAALSSYVPSRTQTASPIAPETRTKAWFESLDPVTWNDLQGNSRSTLLTEPYTDAKGMIALLKRIYTDKTIPGAKYSAPRDCDIPYQTIEKGWNIIGTNYLDDAVIKVNSRRVYIREIEILDGNRETIRDYKPEDGTLTMPTGWETTSDGYYWYCTSSNGGSVAIPAAWLQNDYGFAEVKVYCRPQSASYNGVILSLGNQTYDFTNDTLTYTSGYVSIADWIFPGTINTPPDDNGYTPLLVKLKDGINSDPNVLAPWNTSSAQELENYFTTYVDEIQLMTDGLRVGENGDNPGTAFSYTGNLNRFYFISKGKMFYYAALDAFQGYDRAPFYSMYEEFSANDVADETGFTDFYIRMMKGESYPIVHDCMGVIYRQHYFSMAGKQGTSSNDVSSLVFFIPDYRGVLNSDWRTYDVNHQPRIGMYIITLDAEAHASTTQEGYYDVVVNWESNLDDITDNTVPQTYKLYEIMYNEETGKNDTTLVYTGPNTTWTKPYEVGKPDSYPITYYVIGTPDNTTNPDFYDKSNDDEVIIPGENDFLALYRLGYESDYVIGANENDDKEKNYYRNYLSVQNLEALGNESITPNTIGTGKRTLVLYRLETAGETIVAYLDLMMEGNKPYYRIRYVKENQDVEPGFTGPTNYTTNN